MRSLQSRLLQSFLAAVALMLWGLPSISPAEEVRDGFRSWIDRPWEFRYFISVAYPAYGKTHDASEARRLAKRKLDPSLPVEPQTVFPYVDIPLGPDPLDMAMYEHASLTEIKFDSSGRVLSPNQSPNTLSAHLTQIGALILASGSSRADLLYELGIWYTGRSGEDLAFAPAICSRYDMESRYVPGHRPDGWEGGFGCREFGYYLRSKDHPYIDVTSYEESGPYIRPFLGWGRFDIPPKPVIGNHLGSWVCLYECPDGQKPGIIPDINAWATKHGWPVPKPPKRQPLFPDPKRSPGSFVD